MSSQADQDDFGEWLAQEAARLAPTITSAAAEFASGIFTAVATALHEGNVHNDLDAQVEWLRVHFTEAAQELGIDEPEAVAFMARVENLAETGVGSSNPAEYYQEAIARALQDLQEAIAKASPTPGEVHVLGPSRRRRGRRRTFTELAKGTGLYVERPLVNTKELVDWAQSQGLPTLDKFPHVTICHSKAGIPWTEAKDTVVIWPRQFGRVGVIGNEGAVAIFFASDRLTERWKQAREDGATWDYAGYSPHLTLFHDSNWGKHQAVLSIPLPPFPLVFGPERAGPVEEDLYATLRVTKTSDNEKRLVTGWVSIIEDEEGRPIEDSQGDIIDEDELETAAHHFMKESREAGDSHARVKGIGTVVDSVVFTKGLKAKLGLPTNFPTGWLITIHVTDDSVWNRVKKGELASFSIGGTGVREAV